MCVCGGGGEWMEYEEFGNCGEHEYNIKSQRKRGREGEEWRGLERKIDGS